MSSQSNSSIEFETEPQNINFNQKEQNSQAGKNVNELSSLSPQQQQQQNLPPSSIIRSPSIIHTKSIIKGGTPHKVLSFLKIFGAISEENAFLREQIYEGLKELNKNGYIGGVLRRSTIDGLLIKRAGSDTKEDIFYISEEGLKTLEKCENPVIKVKLQTKKRSSSPLVPPKCNSSLRKLVYRRKYLQMFKEYILQLEIKGITDSGCEGKIAILLSMYSLGAINSRNAVMKSDIISEGRRFTTKFRMTRLNGGNYNYGNVVIKELKEKGFIKGYLNKLFDKFVFFLSEQGNEAVRKLSDMDFEIGFTLYSNYENTTKLRDIKRAILCTMYVNDCPLGRRGFIYPFIITEVNHMVDNIREMDNGIVTPEYYALYKLDDSGYITKFDSTCSVNEYCLYEKGKNFITKHSDDPKIQKYFRIARERKEKLLGKKETEKKETEKSRKRRKSHPDIVTESQLQSPETKRAKLIQDSPSSPQSTLFKETKENNGYVLEFTGEQQNSIICIDDDDNIIYVENSNEPKSYYNMHQGKRLKDFGEIDRRIAQKYPSLTMDQAFSIHFPRLEDIILPNIVGVKLIVDTRENKKISEDINKKFMEEGLNYEKRALEAGDYVWVAIGDDGKEYLLNAIIERKANSDFVNSYNRIRKECLKREERLIEIEHENTKYYKQLAKMRATGINNILYVIEGSFRWEASLNNVSFEEMQQQIESVHEKDNLKLIRTLSQEDTIAFLVDITRSLENALREGKLTEKYFTYPLRGLDELKEEDPFSAFLSNLRI